MSNDICVMLRAFLERVWNEGDIDAADTYIARSYTIHHDPGDPWDGQTLDIEAFKARVRASRAPFPDQHFDIVDMIGGEDRIAVSWRWHGTHAGDIPAFPASGKKIAMSGLTIYSFDGARISGHWQVADRLGVFQQLTAGANY